jgi:cobalt/nickel transport system permease protein
MHHAFMDSYADHRSPVHSMDATVKLIAWAILVVALVVCPAPYALPTFAVLAGLLWGLARLPLGMAVHRLLHLAPFLGVIALSALFRGNGGLLFLALTAKAALAVLLTLVLISTTRFTRILEALKRLRVPGLLVSLLSFMYRYTFVLEDQFLRARRAAEARSVRPARWKMRLKVLSHILGAVLIRTYERAERIYLAMCARGYRHENGR